MAVLLIASIRQQSQTFDESIHLFAGFEYWKHADFGHNPEHPPLVKLVATLPLLPMHLTEPPPVPIPFFKAVDTTAGGRLLYDNNADAILMRGRMMAMLFTLALGVIVFFAGREMFGPLAGLLALLLFVFEPVVLSNGALVTTDMGLSCMFFATVYSFYRYTKLRSPFRLVVTAILFALTLATKQSGALILPTILLLALVDLLLPGDAAGISTAPRSRALSMGIALLVICIVGYAGLWAIYGFRYSAHPGGLPMMPPFEVYAAALHSPLQRSTILFLGRHHLLPEAYLYGWADILQIPEYRPTYLLGRVFVQGPWFFLPVLFLFKTTLTLLALLLLLSLARIQHRRRELLFLALPAALFFVLAVISHVTIGVRHILPVYPFCIVLAGAAAAHLALRSRAWSIAIAAIIAFAIVSSLHSFPNYLAYSNELDGGPANTWRLATDANSDWGQGLKWTKAYLDRHPTSDCWIAYTDPFVPVSYFGIPCKPLLGSISHVIGYPEPPPPTVISGTVFISSHEIDGALWGPGDLNPYAVFRDRKPDDIIGHTVMVYRGTFPVALLAAKSNTTLAMALLNLRHQPQQALALAQLAATEAPDSAEAHAVLAHILLATGRTAEANEHFALAERLAQADHPEYQGRTVDQIRSLPTPPVITPSRQVSASD
jgi:tetratricopeptide (TPR) repeat protein